MNRYLSTLLLAGLCVATNVEAQDSRFTREQVLSMSVEQLSELSLEDLMQAVEVLGVSSVDELFAMIMNKNVSSASKSEEDAFTSALSSTVLTYNELRSYGVTTIEEALKLIPGVIVQQKHNGTYDIVIRGLNNIPDNQMLVSTENANILMMVDGRITHNYAMGAANMEHLPISVEDVERIEVVRGAASALYGANAVQGVINIITRKPDATNYLVSGSIQAGNNRTVIGDVALRKAFNDKFAAGVTFNLQNRKRPDSDIYVVNSGGWCLPNENGEYVNHNYVDTDGDGVPDADDWSYVNEGHMGYYSLSDLVKAKTYNSLTGQVVDQFFQTDKFAERFLEDASLARKTWAVNGYLSFTPSDKVRVDLTGGYGVQDVATQSSSDLDHSISYREFKNGYVNMDAKIAGLSLNANFAGGPQWYLLGMDDYQMDYLQAAVSADYDFRIGNSLSIRPGLSWQYVKYEDGDLCKKMGGFFCDAAITNIIAPSLRVNYKVGGLGLMAGIRSDKTNIPDKWNTSWQAAANYEFNDRHFVRFVYGRSFRGPVSINTQCKYEWERTTMPYMLAFLGNETSDLMRLDNFELGYRLRPVNNLLIDFEAYFSKSKDFGALMADNSYLELPSYVPMGLISGDVQQSQIPALMNSAGFIKYGNLPYEVKQFGVSAAADWIITDKLVARLNLNWQKTMIDNYFPYSQNDVMTEQLEKCTGTALYLLNKMGDDAMGAATNTVMDFAQAAGVEAVTKYANEVGQAAAMEAMMAGKSQEEAMAIAQQAGLAASQSAEAMAIAQQAGLAASQSQEALLLGQQAAVNAATGTMTEALASGTVQMVKGADGKDYIRVAHQGYTIDESTFDKIENKATPAFYGSLAFIYKPIKELCFAPIFNFMGERIYKTKYSEETLCPRLTIDLKASYKPMKDFEIFFNARNLLNNKKQEFVYQDKIGGQYTFGIIFGI